MKTLLWILALCAASCVTPRQTCDVEVREADTAYVVSPATMEVSRMIEPPPVQETKTTRRKWYKFR